MGFGLPRCDVTVTSHGHEHKPLQMKTCLLLDLWGGAGSSGAAGDWREGLALPIRTVSRRRPGCYAHGVAEC